MNSWWRIFCVGAALLSAVRVGAYQDYPQAIGDLVYRDSDHQIYGRDRGEYPNGNGASGACRGESGAGRWQRPWPRQTGSGCRLRER